MTRALRKPWSGRSGDLLPQHLQLRDAYIEDLLALRVEAAAPLGWGFLELTLDSGAVAQGLVRVTSLAGRFPSGILALLRASDAPLEGRLPSSAEEGHVVDIWLALANAWDDAPNVSADDGNTRFRPSADYDRGPALAPRLQLLGGSAADLPVERMLVARARFRNGRFALVEETLPPMLRVGGSAYLSAALVEITSALMERQHELLAQRRERPFDPCTFPASDAPTLFFLSATNQALAALPDDAGDMTPYRLHATLAELLGAMEALDAEPHPAIPRYDHGAPGPGFHALVDRLAALIPKLARVPHTAFPLERADAATFSLHLTDASRLRRRVYLVVTGADGRWLETDIPALAKLASDALLPQIMSSAVRGAALAPDFDPPPSFPTAASSACFRVDTRSEYWSDILERRQLRFHFAGAPAELAVALYVLAADR